MWDEFQYGPICPTCFYSEENTQGFMVAIPVEAIKQPGNEPIDKDLPF